MKQLFFALSAVLLLASCSKSDDGGSKLNFAINGVHDVNLDPNTMGSDKLPISVNTVDAGGLQEPVNLSITGLPAGVTADFAPANGTPNFGTLLTFKNDFSGTGGTYPVKIVGSSASGTKEYPMNLTIPSFDGWVLSYPVGPVSYVFNKTSIVKTPGSNTPGDFPVVTIYSGMDRITATFSQADGLPTAAKTFTTVDSKNLASGQVSIEISDINRRSPNSWYISNTGGSARVSFENGKLHLKTAGMACRATSGPDATVAISVVE